LAIVKLAHVEHHHSCQNLEEERALKSMSRLMGIDKKEKSQAPAPEYVEIDGTRYKKEVEDREKSQQPKFVVIDGERYYKKEKYTRGNR
jgi:hypothetical protein